ncbi:putative RNA-binding protein EEED8.10 [Dirofilaria immitis]|nr:putative RNA-binding protein EEED8.10 [Dirofilaria immitis]
MPDSASLISLPQYGHRRSSLCEVYPTIPKSDHISTNDLNRDGLITPPTATRDITAHYATLPYSTKSTGTLLGIDGVLCRSQRTSTSSNRNSLNSSPTPTNGENDGSDSPAIVPRPCSTTSSGFGSGRSTVINGSDLTSISHYPSREELVKNINDLRIELGRRDAKINDLQNYIEKLLARIMEKIQKCWKLNHRVAYKLKAMKYAAIDASTSEIVVALSDINEGRSSDNVPVGNLIRAVSIKHVNQTVFKHPAMQLLVHESHSIFSRAQHNAKLFTLTVSDVLSYSLQYRSIIRSTLSTIPISEYEIKESLTTAELIWSLVEAIFIKTHDSSIVVDLMTWARLCLAHTPYIDEISNLLRSSKIKDSTSSIFGIIYFVLSGMFNNAVTFLETYGNLCDDNAVRCLAKVLSEVKMDLLNNENTALDFISVQEEVRNMCINGVFETNAEAEKVAMIIAGDIPTITSVSAQLDNWFELVPSYLLFVQPCATLPQLKDVVKDCLEIFGISKCNGIDAVMCELFSLDALRALHRISTSSTNWWFPAHLADLLQKADERITSAYGMDIRQHLIIEFWQVGFDYLRETGEEGLSHLELLIAEVPLDNETVATKLCALCDEVVFDQTRKDIARTMAYRLLRAERWGSALSWAIRSRDIEIVSIVADQIISRCAPDQFSSITVVEHFTEVMLLSSSLIFLHRYYKFRKLLESNQKVKAAELLVELIVSDLMPRKFDVILLSDLISILSDEEEVIISKDGTEQLLEHLISYEADGPFEHNSDEWKMRLRTVRYLLLQNLACAITFSAST